MAVEAPSLQRLQSLVDDIYQPGYKVKVISPESDGDVLEAARLLEGVWSESEPLSVAVLSDPDYQRRGIRQRFRQFCLDVCRLSSQHLLLIAVVHAQSSEMAALVVGLPCTADVYQRLSSGEGARDPMAAWLDILHELDEHLDKALNLFDDTGRATVKLLDYFGVATRRLHASGHLTHLLRYAMARVGLELGYTHAVGKLSSPWQKAIITRWGWRFLGEVLYREYEFEGQKPFEKIPTPAAVQLAWTELASTRPPQSSHL